MASTALSWCLAVAPFGCCVCVCYTSSIDFTLQVVGAQKLSAHGAQGCAGHLRFSHFNKLADCVTYVKGVHSAVICGIEITNEACAVQSHPFRGTTAFMMGNEGHGLTKAQLEVCDHCVYIPQHSAATASLNVNAACAIVLHHYAVWAQLEEVM